MIATYSVLGELTKEKLAAPEGETTTLKFQKEKWVKWRITIKLNENFVKLAKFKLAPSEAKNSKQIFWYEKSQHETSSGKKIGKNDCGSVKK